MWLGSDFAYFFEGAEVSKNICTCLAHQRGDSVFALPFIILFHDSGSFSSVCFIECTRLLEILISGEIPIEQNETGWSNSYIFEHTHFYKWRSHVYEDFWGKRSAPVDQTLGSESIHSQLSVATLIAPRNLLGARKSLIYKKKSKKCRTHN